jgi:hypothetical protein
LASSFGTSLLPSPLQNESAATVAITMTEADCAAECGNLKDAKNFEKFILKNIGVI